MSKRVLRRKRKRVVDDDEEEYNPSDNERMDEEVDDGDYDQDEPPKKETKKKKTEPKKQKRDKNIKKPQPTETGITFLSSELLPFKNPDYEKTKKSNKKRSQWKTLKQILQSEGYESLPPNIPTYVNIEAAPSVLPSKKYCDITGFPANYTDPKTKLRFFNSQIFAMVRNLPERTVQDYLSLRNATTRF